jgi:hypothetical protein
MSDVITWGERPDSGETSANPRAITLKYVLAGIFERSVAIAYAVLNTAPMVAGLWRQDVKLISKGFKIWWVDVPYGPIQQSDPDSGEYRWNFDTTGGTAKITQAKQHVKSYAPSDKTPPNHKGAIGVKEKGEVEGVEIVIPAFKWTETHTLNAKRVGWSYSQILKAITAHVNYASFRGFPAGQVRFDGAQGGQSSKDPGKLEVTYHFTQSDDVEGVTAGDIKDIDKKGWQYLWYEYETVEDKTAVRKAKQPVAAHVERVYDSANFNLLGVGR